MTVEVQKRFNLTQEDKALLKGYGYLDEDFPQIKKAYSRTTFILCENTKVSGIETEINGMKVIELLGRENFLSGLARSAFHWSAYRNITENSGIYFDSSKLFQE